jgi:hypothetical protein
MRFSLIWKNIGRGKIEYRNDFSLLKNKLGASPQPVESLEVVRLECWNPGILEKWVLGYWIVGLMVRRRRNDKIKNGKYPLKNPLFHHSTIPLLHD